MSEDQRVFVEASTISEWVQGGDTLPWIRMGRADGDALTEGGGGKWDPKRIYRLNRA